MDVYFTVPWGFCTFEILLSKTLKGFPDSSVGKESACNAAEKQTNKQTKTTHCTLRPTFPLQ